MIKNVDVPNGPLIQGSENYTFLETSNLKGPINIDVSSMTIPEIKTSFLNVGSISFHDNYITGIININTQNISNYVNKYYVDYDSKYSPNCPLNSIQYYTENKFEGSSNLTWTSNTLFSNETKISNTLMTSSINIGPTTISISSSLSNYTLILPKIEPEPNQILTIKDNMLNWTTTNIVNQLCICWSPDLNLFCSLSSTISSLSPDGLSWTTYPLPYTGNYSSIAWSPNYFVAVNSSKFIYSSDGISWSISLYSSGYTSVNVGGSPLKSYLLTSVSNFPGLRNVVDPTGQPNYEATSEDWVSGVWSEKLLFFCILINNSSIVGHISWSTSFNVTTYDTGFNNMWSAITWSPELSIFCAAGNSNVMLSYDGISWSNVYVLSDNYTSITWSSELALFCMSGSFIMTSPDGYVWSLSSNIDVLDLKLVWSPELNIFCGISLNNGLISSINSTKELVWSYMSPGGPDRSIQFKNNEYIIGSSALVYNISDELETTTINCTTSMVTSDLETSSLTFNDQSTYQSTYQSTEQVANITVQNGSNFNLIFPFNKPDSSSLLNIDVSGQIVQLSYVTSTVIPQDPLNSVQYISNLQITGSSDFTYIEEDQLSIGRQIYQGYPISFVTIGPTTINIINIGLIKIFIEGSYLYSLTNTEMISMNLSFVTSSIMTITNPIDLFVLGNYVYTITNNELFVSLSTSFTTISFTTSFTTISTTSINNGTSIFVSDKYAYITESTGLLVVDITTPISPTTTANITLGPLVDVVISDQIIYTISSSDLYILSTLSYQTLSIISVGSSLVTLYVQNGYYYVGSNSGLYIINSLNNIVATSIGLPYPVTSIFVSNDQIFVSYDQYVSILDHVLNVLSVLSVLNFNENINSVYINGSYLYVSGSLNLYKCFIYGSYLNSLETGSLKCSLLNVMNDVITDDIVLNNLNSSTISMSGLTLNKSNVVTSNFDPVTINSYCGRITLNNIGILPQTTSFLTVYNNVVNSSSIILINALQYTSGFPVINITNTNVGSFIISIENIDETNLIDELNIGFAIF